MRGACDSAVAASDTARDGRESSHCDAPTANAARDAPTRIGPRRLAESRARRLRALMKGLLVERGAAAPPGMESLRTFSLGMKTGENVDFSLVLTTADAPAAQLMLKMVHDVMAQAGQSPDTAAMLAKALDIRQDGAKLRFHFVPTPEMIKAAQAQAASASADPTGSFASLQPLLGMLGMGGGPSATTPTQPSPRAEPLVPPQDTGGKIIINGLDGGPREVKPEK